MADIGAFREYIDPRIIEMLKQQQAETGMLDAGLGPMTNRSMAGEMNLPPSWPEPTAGERVGGGFAGGVLDYGSMPARAFMAQGETAGNAAYEAAEDPSLQNIALAAGHTGMALPFARPYAAGVGAFAAGGLDALARDAGLVGGEAQAKPWRAETGGLTVDNLAAVPLPDKVSGADRAIAMTGHDPQADRQQALDLARIQAEAGAKGQAEAARLAEEARQAGLRAREAQEQKEARDRMRRGVAESLRNNELAKAGSFRDTDVGKFYDKMGGFAPIALGATFGGLARAARGPAKNLYEDVVMPWAVGTSGVLTGQNAPDLYDLAMPLANPEKKAYETYARELPIDDPSRQGALEYAQGLPKDNPVYTGAYERLSDPWLLARRGGLAAVEGLGGLVGADAVSASVRAGKALSRVPGDVAEGVGALYPRFMKGVRGSPGAQGPGGGTPPPPPGGGQPGGGLGGQGGPGQGQAGGQGRGGNAGGNGPPPPGGPGYHPGGPPPGGNHRNPGNPGGSQQSPPIGRYSDGKRDLTRNVLSEMVDDGIEVNSIAAKTIENIVNTGQANKIPAARMKALTKNTKEYLKSLGVEVTGDIIKSMPKRWKGKDLLSIAAVGGAGAAATVGNPEWAEILGNLEAGRAPGAKAPTTQKSEKPKPVSYSDVLRRLGGS